jgi:flagellar assembly protein FliH
MSTRLIRGHEVEGPCQPWQAPEVRGPTLRGEAEDIRGARSQAVREGFEEGRRAGLEAARKEVASRAEALERVLDSLARPFEMLEQRFHEEVLALVKAVARALVRRELRLDPTHIAGVVREGLAALPMAAPDVVVRLHPDDAAVLRECLAGATGSGDELPGPVDAQGGRAWRVEVDPLMERGGCVVATPQSQVDGRLETRLGRVIAALFDEERGADADAPDSHPRG